MDGFLVRETQNNVVQSRRPRLRYQHGDSPVARRLLGGRHQLAHPVVVLMLVPRVHVPAYHHRHVLPALAARYYPVFNSFCHGSPPAVLPWYIYIIIKPREEKQNVSVWFLDENFTSKVLLHHAQANWKIPCQIHLIILTAKNTYSTLRNIRAWSKKH